MVRISKVNKAITEDIKLSLRSLNLIHV